MLSNGVIISFTFGYLVLLFAIAWFSEKSEKSGRRLSTNPYVYSLSLAVYCTAWTYYGSVGRAATNGLEFLTIYIGPSLIAPLWWIVMRKIIRICKVQQLSSIADFISSRYGKNVTLGGIVTIFSLLGILPYTALQIKAVASSFDIMSVSEVGYELLSAPFYKDSAFYLALGLALFTVLFGTRHIEATARHEGMVMAIAFESIFKLLAFLVVGVFVSFFVFDGFGDIFAQASAKGLEDLFVLQGENNASEWFWMSVLSMMAVLFLPRQFQMGVIENNNEKHLDTAMWLFPLYLLLINIFVLPIALGGLVYFPTGTVDADTFVLALPIAFDQEWMALLVYLGGFSAATGMIIVSTIALSTMVSNNLVMPLLLVNDGFQKRYQHRLGSILIWTRRVTIFGIILLAYIYYKQIAGQFSLVSIGLISFVAIAQFTPAIIGGIFWKKGARLGALSGILAGFVLWFYTLVVPTMITAGYLSPSIMTDGLFGLGFLKPYSLLGLDEMSYVTHGLFYSLSVNLILYLVVSLFSQQSSKEHNQAVIFVDIFKYSSALDSSIVWKGQAFLPDLKSLLDNFLGNEKTEMALDEYRQISGKTLTSGIYADPELVSYSERLLSGIIGSASARIMVASVVKEEEISMEEVIGILRETQELKSLNEKLNLKTRELKKASDKLQKMNEALRMNDMLKDEFISTVTHEMKTPLTSIRAFSEILLDEDIEDADRKRFLEIIIQETQRMTRLIDQVLDLERFDSGRQKMNFEKTDPKICILQSADSMMQVFREKNIDFSIHLNFETQELMIDEDRIKQVVLNLLSNAAKFAASKIRLVGFESPMGLMVQVCDDGKGIKEEELPYIFEKFYQANNQTSKKPIGSGLGLAISKKIIEYHGGELSVKRLEGMTCFEFTLPFQSEKIKLNQEKNNHD
ncbi:histidine kinase [Rhodonellum psychrophilum GCM71 = DSM 17998]|uniref:histidine kinase n=2 Tax=Rhodonellum TaxID=336827 RepID=U5C1E8_9BACT|nr:MULTISPECIES: sensor histidine kinase [Rhodonellum]ERM83868.1 histidine kinase [Rhodonellum psychrophilum GCM71 = DSM 17998]SDY67086.1 Na+/proline symporter [Rhodonellum ikkaensis]